jgi:hypothetical protein
LRDLSDLVKDPNDIRTGLVCLGSRTQRSHLIVVDTSPRAEGRLVIALGKAFGARIVGYCLDASVSDCLRRDALRQGRERTIRA